MLQKKVSIGKNSLLSTNIRYGLIGIICGVVMSTFIWLFNPGGIQLRNALLNILFSFFITLSIANIIRLVHCYFHPSTKNFWKFVLLYYCCNLAGLFIGIEVSYLIVSFIFNTGYQFLNHIGDYKFSTFITLIIGTLILLYHFQRVNADSLLKEKEMELLKLNQLKTQVELQALQAKINPHFLYNALNAIVSLIHEDPDKAEDMTMKLSKLFRYSINTMQENFCTVKEEIDILNTYLAIEKVRFGNRINFNISYEPELADQPIPRFLLQPLVENALKHGLKDIPEKGELAVAVTKMDQNLVFFVYDNGIAFPEELIAGYGLQSTFDKLTLLYGDKYDVQLNNQPKKHLKISIPLS
jgi:two-component system LytT family sensor kinase